MEEIIINHLLIITIMFEINFTHALFMITTLKAFNKYLNDIVINFKRIVHFKFIKKFEYFKDFIAQQVIINCNMVNCCCCFFNYYYYQKAIIIIYNIIFLIQSPHHLIQPNFMLKNIIKKCRKITYNY